MELSATPNDNGRWRADLKNWAEESHPSEVEEEEGNGKPSLEVSESCISSQDNDEDEDSCWESSKAAHLFPLDCVHIIGIISTINYTLL